MPTLRVLKAAALDPGLPTSWLLEQARKTIVDERADVETDHLALCILHQRVGAEVLGEALSLLKDSDPVSRQLGCRLLREMPGLSEAPYPHSPQAIATLMEMLEKETDDDVFSWGIRAIGWQCHADGHACLLKMQADPREEVRYAVAMNLLNFRPENEKIDGKTAAAYLKFAGDPDEEIRWSVYYDIAEFPELFVDFREELLQRIAALAPDPETETGEKAARACEALRAI